MSSNFMFRVYRVLYIYPFVSYNNNFCDKLDHEDVSTDEGVGSHQNPDDPKIYKGLLNGIVKSRDLLKKRFDLLNTSIRRNNVHSKDSMSETASDDNLNRNKFYGAGLTQNLCLKMMRRADLIYNTNSELRYDIFGVKKVLVKGNAELWSVKCDPTSNYELYGDDRCKFFTSTKSPQTEYFVIGKFDDICCDDFIKSYVDNDYRKTWDGYTVHLQTLGVDQQNDCEIIDWIITTGIPFRGLQRYVYCRKVIFSDDERFKAILSHSIIDENKVHDILSDADGSFADATLINYRSLYLLYPKTTFDQPGFNYIMYYYEEATGDGFSFPDSFINRVVINTVENIRKSVLCYKN